MTPSSYDIDSKDDYPYYRGMRLQFLPGKNGNGKMYWRSPREDGFQIEVKSGHDEILSELLKIRPEGGSCRITEMKEVLVKVPDQKDSVPEIPRYVCQLEKTLQFRGDIDNAPSELEPGSLWTGIYDGTRLSFIPTNTGEQKVWWGTVEDFSVRYQLDAKMPREILLHLTSFKPLGGRFCITPEGYVLTLVDKGMLSHSEKTRYKELFESQKYDPLRLIDIKESRTGLFPIFVGVWDIDEIHFKKPRRWGDKLDNSERNKMLNTIAGLLGDDPAGMVIPTSDIEGDADDPDFIFEAAKEAKDHIVGEDDPEVALLLEEE